MITSPYSRSSHMVEQKDGSFRSAVTSSHADNSPMMSQESSELSPPNSQTSVVSKVKMTMKDGKVKMVLQTKPKEGASSDGGSLETDSEFEHSSSSSGKDKGKKGGGGGGKLNSKKMKKYVKKMLEEKRKEWAEQDIKMYAKLDSYNLTKEKLDDTENLVTGLSKLFREHEQLNIRTDKEVADRFEEHQKTQQDLQSQINKNAQIQVKDKADTDAK